ncbi:MAG: hypothetical protein ACUZ8H_01860, partial [Candidatus Anammoxibacter sp.]
AVIGGQGGSSDGSVNAFAQDNLHVAEPIERRNALSRVGQGTHGIAKKALDAAGGTGAAPGDIIPLDDEELKKF